MQETQETWVRSLSWEDSPGGEHSSPLQYSCLENPMDRGTWWAMAHEVTKSGTRLSNLAPSMVRKQAQKDIRHSRLKSEKPKAVGEAGHLRAQEPSVSWGWFRNAAVSFRSIPGSQSCASPNSSHAFLEPAESDVYLWALQWDRTHNSLANA